jgi:hypothetical protein
MTLREFITEAGIKPSRKINENLEFKIISDLQYVVEHIEENIDESKQDHAAALEVLQDVKEQINRIIIDIHHQQS